MMYYLWCLGSTGNGHTETSNTPSSTNYNLGASMPAGVFPFKLLPFRNEHKALCQSLTPQSVHSFTCRLTRSFAITLSPVVASRSLSPNRKNYSLFPTDESVSSARNLQFMWSVVFITTSCIMQTPFLERGSIMYQVNSISGSIRYSPRSRFPVNSWVL